MNMVSTEHPFILSSQPANIYYTRVLLKYIKLANFAFSYWSKITIKEIYLSLLIQCTLDKFKFALELIWLSTICKLFTLKVVDNFKLLFMHHLIFECQYYHLYQICINCEKLECQLCLFRKKYICSI